MRYKYYHTHLTSRNPAQAVEFYQKMFGAKVVRYRISYGTVPMCDLDVEGLRLRISSLTGAEASGGLPEGHYGLHHIGILTDNLNEAVADLKAKGAEFVAGPTSARPVTKYAFLKAPENTFIELVEMAAEELKVHNISPDWTGVSFR